MFLKIQKINNELINKSEKEFWDLFCKKLKKQKYWTYNESLIARYLIKQNENKFSSISHKKNLIFIWINNKKIWVDIEIFKERNSSLLNKFLKQEYLLLWEKNWYNFYILWTAKESIIKYENLQLDIIYNIIIKKYKKINKNIWDIFFDKKIIFELNSKKFIVYSWNKKNIFYSICILKSIF